MIIMHGLIGIALAAAQSALPATPPPEPPPSSSTKLVPVDGFTLGTKAINPLTQEQAEAMRSQCSDRRFEATAEGLIDGEMKRRKITLCAALGESDAQWITKLENAVAWTKAQPGLSDPVKTKLVSELQTKISQLKFAAPMRALPSRGLPAADALVATVPPMPAPLPRSTLSGAAMLALAPPVVARPPLTIRCLGDGERGLGTRCDRVGVNTVFVVHADGNLAGPVTLRFLRRGELRAESPVAALRQGQVIRLRLPSRVCSGVVRADVAIEIMAGQSTSKVFQIADKVGPFELRC